MNATWVVTVFEIIDTIMEGVDHRSHVVAPVPDAEVFTVAVVAGDRASGVAGAVGAGAGQAGGWTWSTPYRVSNTQGSALQIRLTDWSPLETRRQRSTRR